MSKKFNEAKGMDTSSYNNLLIVDGLNLAFRYKYANKKIFAQEYINTVESLARSYDAKTVIILSDGGSSYREAIYPEYKGNRKELRANQTPEEEQEFKEFLDEFIKAFDRLKEMYYAFRFVGVEADDIAAYLVKHYADKYNHTWLISSDKDWDLLISENTSRFSYVTRKEIKMDNWEDHYSYNPEDHISIKVLQGDKGDHIPGIEGVGIKRAETLIREYGTAFDIYEALPIDSKYKYIQKLNEFGKTILMNYELMDLLTYCELAIGEENIKQIEEELNDTKN